MPRSYATTEYVHSRVVQYCSQVVDLRWCISIHSCEVCPFQSSDATSPFECQAVHYGLCTPIRRSLLRHPARLQQPQKRQVDIPVRFIQVTHSYMFLKYFSYFINFQLIEIYKYVISCICLFFTDILYEHAQNFVNITSNCRNPKRAEFPIGCMFHSLATAYSKKSR